MDTITIIDKFPINTDKFIQNHQIYYKLYEPLFNGEQRIYLDDVNNQLQDEFMTYARQVINEYEMAKQTITANGWIQCQNCYMLWHKLNNVNQNIKFIKVIKEYLPNMVDVLSTYSNVIFIYEYLKRGGKLKIAISRLFGDIVGMSYHRGWASCMNIGNKDSNMPNRIIGDLGDGTLIAYIIMDTDKNILQPIARTLIKPYKILTMPQNKILLGVPGTCYGVLNEYKHNSSILSNIVNEYCKNVFNYKLIEQFKICDFSESTIFSLFGQTYKEGIVDIDWYKLLGNNTATKYCTQIIDQLNISGTGISVQQLIFMFYDIIAYLPIDFYGHIAPHVKFNDTNIANLNETRKVKLKKMNKNSNNTLFKLINLDQKLLVKKSQYKRCYTVDCRVSDTSNYTIYCA